MRKCHVPLLWSFHQNLKTIMLDTFASILDFIQMAFKDIISRASNSDVSVHFFHKSSCAITIPLDALDKLYIMTIISLIFFVCFSISIVYSFLILYSYFRGLCAFA